MISRMHGLCAICFAFSGGCMATHIMYNARYDGEVALSNISCLLGKLIHSFSFDRTPVFLAKGSGASHAM